MRNNFTELYTEFGFYHRLTKIEEEFPSANIILHKTGKLPQVRFRLHESCSKPVSRLWFLASNYTGVVRRFESLSGRGY